MRRAAGGAGFVTAEKYRHTFTPITIGNVTLKNRIIMPAHTTNYGAGHLPTDRHLEYHRARARGGVAAIIFESIRVQKNSLGRPQGVAGYERASVPIFARIVEAVHREGAKIFGQVIHLGRQVEGDFERTVSWGPSPVRWSPTAQVPHAMTRREMEIVIQSHIVTARNVLEAGFDGFEIHLGHGHMLQQFLSPVSNIRDDEFGGSRENRMRFPLAVLEAVRAAIGPGVCMGIRISGEEYLPGGLELPDMQAIATAIASRVKLDFVNVSHSAYHASNSLATQMADMNVDATPFRALPRGIRDALRAAGHAIPVFAVCRFRSIAEADAMIAAGGADVVGMARAHLADPEIVAKTLSGREDEVRPCIGCNQGCAAMVERNLPMTCLINPRGGREGDMASPESSPSASPKRILVIGGGPAGLETAWVAAARGHQVTLWEKSGRIGGQLNVMRAMPHRADFLKLLDWQERQCRKHQVRIVTGRAGEVDAVRAENPDLAIVATGSRPQRFRFASGREALSVEDALARPAVAGERLALFDMTGEWSTLAFAEHVARSGRSLVVFVPVAAYAWRTTIYSSLANRKRLREFGVKLALLRAPRDWDGTTLTAEDVSTGALETHAGFAAVVVAQYNTAEDSLLHALEQAGVAARAIGDSLAPRNALEAVYEGHELALSL
jgi:2,4-dienoyl-CoA reductase-like NADH-dependent reductase (Old Yellow Enzyme family)